MRPKLNEVAQQAGVSEATVSRVMNAKPGVAESTRRRVLDVLSDMGYRDVTRSVRSGVVGIITPELTNPIFPSLAESIESQLARHGLLSMICPVTAETVAEQDYLDHFVEIGAAGVIVVNGQYAAENVGYSTYLRLAGNGDGFPVVLVNGMGPVCPLPAVSTDIHAAARLGVSHLVALGHRRIGALVGPHRYWTSQMFADGYEAGLRKAGIDYDSDLTYETLFTYEGGQAGMASLLEQDVTAVLAPADLMALGAVNAVRLNGGTVPGDVSVIGFDGTEMTTLTDPQLTTLRQPVIKMAATVASMFQSLVHGETVPPGVHLFRPELVVGESTGVAPVRV